MKVFRGTSEGRWILLFLYNERTMIINPSLINHLDLGLAPFGAQFEELISNMFSISTTGLGGWSLEFGRCVDCLLTRSTLLHEFQSFSSSKASRVGRKPIKKNTR